MKMGRQKAKSNFLRIVSILLGVLGAGWLFSSVWREVFEYIENYSLSQNFFTYFFSTCLFSVSTLLVSVLFFIVSLRDLEPLRDVFSIITAVVSAVALVAYVVHIINSLTTVKAFFAPESIVNVANVMLLLAYFLYSLYVRNGGTIKNTAWIIAIVGIIILFIGALYGYITKDFSAKRTISHALTGLAHLALFYCGLR